MMRVLLGIPNSSIFVMWVGIVIEVRLSQNQNADFPMLFTLLGMVIEVRLLHLINALSPMLVTLLGIVMEVRLERIANAPSPILVTLLGIIVDAHPCINVLLFVSMIALQLSRES